MSDLGSSADLARLVCRPARSADKQDVLEFTRTIWNGNDYVPLIWDEWLADPEGLLASAELGGRVVGIAKLNRLAKRQWWMAGLRVNPGLQGRGIARHLHDYVLAVWERMGGGVIRLETSYERKTVHHLCEQTGFTKLGEYSDYSAVAVESARQSFETIPEVSIQKVIAQILESPLLPRFNGLVGLDWKWAAPEEEIIGSFLRQGRGLSWNDGEGLLLYSVDRYEPDPLLAIEFLTCPPARISALLADTRCLARSLNTTKVTWSVPLEGDFFPALGESGFDRDWDGSVYMYEKRQQAGNTADPVG